MNDLISASILSADFSNLGKQIQDCEKAGVDWIHIDVMDGHFVPNLTMGPFIVHTCRKITRLPLDCHLMVEKPESLINAFAEAGATSITIHPENNQKVLQTLQEIRNLGCLAGIALNPVTSAQSIKQFLPFIDLVLVMTVNPGYSGQSFMPEMVKKVASVRKLIDRQQKQIHLEVDGGITANTLPLVHAAGADVFVSATAIFKHPMGISSGVHELKQTLLK